MNDFVLREPRVLAHSGDICWSIVFDRWSPRIDQFANSVTWPASAIEPIDMILDEFDACPKSHLHRFEFFESLILLDWPFTLPITPLYDVQGVVVSDSSWLAHRLGKYLVNMIESSGYV